MGIDSRTAEFLAHSQKRGVDFTTTLTIGRQSLLISRSNVCRILARAGLSQTDRDFGLLPTSDGYCESFIRQLGATTVESIDNSSYEGATHVWDLNSPIPPELKNRYSVVIDGGCLEHVFHYTQALKSCLEMTKIGGHFISVTPANNLCGHGFYQISPELLFRACSSENGFVVDRMCVAAYVPGTVWYEVADPAALRARVVPRGRWPLYLYLVARRVQAKPIFEHAPQQSDYATYWKEGQGDHQRRARSTLGRYPVFQDRMSRLPDPIKRWIFYSRHAWISLKTAGRVAKGLRRVDL